MNSNPELVVSPRKYYYDVYGSDTEDTSLKIIPIVQQFYDQFDVNIDMIEIGPARDYEPRISFISKADKPYCKIVIDVTNLGAAFLPPSKRKWDIWFIFTNISKEEMDILYLNYNLSVLDYVSSKEGMFSIGSKLDETGKVQYAIEHMKPWIDEYVYRLNEVNNG